MTTEWRLAIRMGLLADGAFVAAAAGGLAAGQPLTLAVWLGIGAGLVTTWLAANQLCRQRNGSRSWLLAVCWLLAMWLAGGAAVVGREQLGWSVWASLAGSAAVVLPVVTCFLGWFVVGERGTGVPWRRVALYGAGYAVAMRLLYGAGLDLLPEEAYYWMYAQHPSPGYLDHPPMVAWLIMAGTSLFVNEELGVRLMALVCWIGTTGLVVAGTRRWYGTAAGWVALFMMSTLPFFFAVGFIMTPDVPLVLCWAGYLYCAGRALVDGEGRFWWLAGVFIGLGMLSKYTIALAGLATLVFVLADRGSRHWLRRPETYLSALLAVGLFLPVIYWNAHNDWASFAFQGSRRWTDGLEISPHLLVLSLLVLLTPLGAVAFPVILWRLRHWRPAADDTGRDLRRRRFALVFTVVPLAVFVVFSLRGAPKLNWTGPVWLASLPLLAAAVAGAGQHAGRALRPHWWLNTGLAMMLLCGGGLYWLLLGFPGLPVMPGLNAAPVAWEELGEALERIEDKVEGETGQEPVLMGMDKYFLASQTAFYAEADDLAEGTHGAVGRHLVGRRSLMYRFWCRPEEIFGRDVVIFDTDREDVEAGYLGRHFERLGPVEVVPIVKNGRPLAQLYWRVGYRYREARKQLREQAAAARARAFRGS